jgi:hypothetical protein
MKICLKIFACRRNNPTSHKEERKEKINIFGKNGRHEGKERITGETENQTTSRKKKKNMKKKKKYE